MAFVYNATNEQQDIKIFGNWFSFKPGQIKALDDKLAHGLCVDKKEYGIVGLPAEFEELEYRNSEEGKAILEAKKEEGIANYINHLRSIVMNNQVSLRKDLAMANMQLDPAVLATKGEMKAVEMLAKYQRGKDDVAQKNAEKFKELLKEADKE